MCADYTIEKHQHRLAAWAASRATSRGAAAQGCPFGVSEGFDILEASDFNTAFSLEDLPGPDPEEIDKKHAEWRIKTIEKSDEIINREFTHGVAAKLINCYLKVRFVCAGKHEDNCVRGLHPPVDRQLLKSLADKEFGGYQKQWREFERIGWSNFNSEQYSDVIKLIRKCLKGEPLWKIEKYWEGY